MCKADQGLPNYETFSRFGCAGYIKWADDLGVKGLALTAYHPAAILGSALGYAVSSRGGDYNHVYSSLEHRWPAAKGADAFGSPDAVDMRRPAGKGRLLCTAPCW